MWNDRKMDISVIIPVYNAALYVESCIRSVMAFPGVSEILLIDDGSDDGSGALCDNFAASYPDIVRSIHQPNRGVSAARNYGICVAHCEWLWFVDADDYVLAEFNDWGPLQDLNDADMVITGFEWEEQGCVQTYGAQSTDVPYNLWRCWFRREKINAFGLFFSFGRAYAEDQEFILRYLLNTGRSHIQTISEPCYHYTLRPGSAMTRSGRKWKQIRDLVAVMWETIQLATRQNKLNEKWLWQELRRLLKNVCVIL